MILKTQVLRGCWLLRPGKVRFVDACPISKIDVFLAFNSVERELGSWRWRWEMGVGWVGGWQHYHCIVGECVPARQSLFADQSLAYIAITPPSTYVTLMGY